MGEGYLKSSVVSSNIEYCCTRNMPSPPQYLILLCRKHALHICASPHQRAHCPRRAILVCLGNLQLFRLHRMNTKVTTRFASVGPSSQAHILDLHKIPFSKPISRTCSTRSVLPPRPTRHPGTGNRETRV